MVDREAAVGDGPTQRDSCVAAEIEGLVHRVQRRHPQLLQLLVKAGVVGGDMGHCGRLCQGEDSLLGVNWV